MWRQDGLVPIEGLLKGEQIYSRHEESFAEAPDYYVLTTEFEAIKLTSEHPVWVQAKGWTRAAEVVAGDALATVTGDALVIRNELVKEPLRVYNFSVAFTPSYFVGQSGLWVHNAGTVVCGLKPAHPDAVINALKDFETRRYSFGNETFQLDKSGMKHILERHHPDYWDGSVERTLLSKCPGPWAAYRTCWVFRRVVSLSSIRWSSP